MIITVAKDDAISSSIPGNPSPPVVEFWSIRFAMKIMYLMRERCMGTGEIILRPNLKQKLRFPFCK